MKTRSENGSADQSKRKDERTEERTREDEDK